MSSAIFPRGAAISIYCNSEWNITKVTSTHNWTLFLTHEQNLPISPFIQEESACTTNTQEQSNLRIRTMRIKKKHQRKYDDDANGYAIYRDASAQDSRRDNSPSGQFSKTWWAMSPAESLGLNRNSFVLPLTRMRRRFICNKKSKGSFSYTTRSLIFIKNNGQVLLGIRSNFTVYW